MKNGGVVIHLAPPGSPTARLGRQLGDLGSYATWVNIGRIRRLRNTSRRSTGNMIVPTVNTATPTSWWPTW